MLYYSKDLNPDYAHQVVFLTPPGNDEHTQKLQSCSKDDPNSPRGEHRPCLPIVPRSKVVSCRTVYAMNSPTYDGTASEEALRIIQYMESQRQWTLWSALREMYRRDASKEEGLVHSVLGLLGVTITPNAVRYGVTLRGAMRILADAVHLDRRFLLTVVESFHGNFIDGFSVLPAFRDITAVPAPRLDHLRTLGVAEFCGYDGMRITAPAVVVDVEKIIDESNAINEALELPIQELVDVLEEKGSLDSYRSFQMTATGRQTTEGLANIGPGTPSLGVTLIAATQVETPDSDKFRKRGEPLVTFCCLVCTDGGSVKCKVGIALVVASKYIWREQRHLAA